MFAATVVLLAVMMQQLVAGVAYCFRCWAIGAGTLMVLAQAVSSAAGHLRLAVMQMICLQLLRCWLCCLCIFCSRRCLPIPNPGGYVFCLLLALPIFIGVAECVDCYIDACLYIFCCFLLFFFLPSFFV
jgi:hypothetical protein